MFDTPRPYPGMSTLPISRNPAMNGLQRRFTSALATVSLAVSALLAVPPAHASVHHAVAPVHRDAAARGPVAASHRAAATAERHVAAGHAAHGTLHEVAHGRAQGSGRVQADKDEQPRRKGKLARGGRAADEDLPRTRTLARRDDAHTRGRRAAQEQMQDEPTTSSRKGRGKRQIASMDETSVRGPVLRRGRSTAVVAHSIPLEADSAADPGTEDRVHAWYRARQGSRHESGRDVAGNVVPTVRPGTSKNTPLPDLTTAPHKATLADFERAAAAQRQTIQSVAEQNSRQTTAADDAADAETHIPSTAPTEREPAPFQHGDLPAATSVPGTTGHRAPAPIVRQKSDTTSSITGKAAAPATTVDLSPPAVTAAPPAASGPTHVDLHPVTASAVTYHAASAAPDAAVLAANPTLLAANGSPRTVRAVAAEIAASPTPHPQLPSSPVVMGRKPAIAAVQAGAARPVLDPAVAAGMADDTFDDDNTPATVGTAIRLATDGVRPRGRTPFDDDATAAAAVKVNLFDGNGHLLLLPPMKGTHEILVHQNQMALSDGLERIQNDSQLADMRRSRLLVDLPDDDSLYPNDALPLNRRYARPWTVRFLHDLARAHYARFGTPLIVTSAARTVEFQRRLVRVNGNAAPPTGDIASPHLYGQAIDLAKRGMSLTEIIWMRAYLTPVEDDGKIDVEEEFQQACFHISVYRRYLGIAAPQKPAQQLQRPTLLQANTAPVPVPEKKRHLPTALLATHLP